MSHAWLELLCDESFNSIPIGGVHRCPSNEKAEVTVLKDFFFLSMRCNTVCYHTLANVYRPGVLASVPDDVNSSQPGEVSVTEVYR